MLSRYRPIPRHALLALGFALAACAPPEGAELPISADARAAPAPRLAETAAFDAALERAAPDAERLETEAAGLAARAEALRARAAALAPPVVEPDARPRLAPPDAAPAEPPRP
jgi:hypothetical protein